jgi:hypothetical protein
LSLQLAPGRETEWEWKHAVAEEATDPWAWLETQERKRRVEEKAGANLVALPVAVEAYVLSRYRVGFIGVGEEAVRVAVADAPTRLRATGIVGYPIELTANGDTFPWGVLLAGLDEALIGTVAPPTVRVFKIDDASDALTLCPSGISVTGAAVWARITDLGRYILVGCDGRDAVAAAVQVLSRVRPLILQEDLRVRQQVLTATLEGLLLAPTLRATVDESTGGAEESEDEPDTFERRDSGRGARTSMSTLKDLVDRFARDQEPPEAQLLGLIRSR